MGIEGFVDGVKAKAARVGAVSKATVYGIKEDVVALVDRVTENRYLADLGNTVWTHASEGKDKVAEVMSAKYSAYNARMDELVMTHPESVGFWDGFVNAYLNTACERRPRSSVYTQHVKYGKVLGFATSLAALPHGKTGKVLAFLPYISRGVPYLRKKMAEAQVQVQAQTA